MMDESQGYTAPPEMYNMQVGIPVEGGYSDSDGAGEFV